MDKIRKGDEVIVLTGKDKGKRGLVQQRVDAEHGRSRGRQARGRKACPRVQVQQRVDAEHVVVEGVNVVKKAVKPNPMTGATGGIIDKLMPIHVSNVALFNAATGKADRVGVKLVDGKRVRVYKSSGEVVKV